jgi:hypothetical protein
MPLHPLKGEFVGASIHHNRAGPRALRPTHANVQSCKNAKMWNPGKILENSGNPGKILEKSWNNSGKSWEILENSGKFWTRPELGLPGIPV